MWKVVCVVCFIFVCSFAEERDISYSCRFAFDYSNSELWDSLEKQEDFLHQVMYWEGNFAKHRVGLDEILGVTYDGHGIDYYTGLPLEGYLHYWSAASKESVHLMMLAKALQKNEYALQFVCNDCGNSTAQYNYALTLLERKITTYEQWNMNYPGFGGFLPWYDANSTGLSPNEGWSNQVPALDNGEMVWGIRAVAYELIKNGEMELGQRYLDYWNMLADNSMMIFYDGAGRVRSVTIIVDNKAQPTPDNYYIQCDTCLLDDPYEGEMMTFFMVLYGDWSGIEHEKPDVWELKRAKLQSVDYQFTMPGSTEIRNITVQRGWWFSSHEQWKYLELPYLDSDINNRVFMNGERARTWNSNVMKYPGMFASVTDVSDPGNENPAYLSAAGIPSIAFQPIEKFTTITPYSTFPLFLTGNQTVAISWYHLMLQGPSMQGLFGSTESCNSTGTAISPVLTWDSKITTLCGILGGISDITREVLKQDHKYEIFVQRVNYEWNRVFDELHGEDLPFAVPSVNIPYPSSLGDFSTCQQS